MVRKRADSEYPTELIYRKTPAMDNYIEEGGSTISVRIHARDAETTGNWGKRLGIPYAGQTLGAFTGLVLDTVLRRRQRRYLTDTEKQALRDSQGRQCNLCGDTLDNFTIFDHIVPLHQMTAEQLLEDFQAICSQCSVNKTVAEARPCVGAIRSHFSAKLWRAYVESPLPPCMVFKETGPEYP